MEKYITTRKRHTGGGLGEGSVYENHDYDDRQHKLPWNEWKVRNGSGVEFRRVCGWHNRVRRDDWRHKNSPCFIGSITSSRASGILIKGSNAVAIVSVDNPSITFTYEYLW